MSLCRSSQSSAGCNGSRAALFSVARLSHGDAHCRPCQWFATAERVYSVCVAVKCSLPRGCLQGNGPQLRRKRAPAIQALYLGARRAIKDIENARLFFI